MTGACACVVRVCPCRDAGRGADAIVTVIVCFCCADIVSLAMHPEGKIVATAQMGKEPFICVWDTETLQCLSILKGFHERAITAMDFSK